MSYELAREKVLEIAVATVLTKKNVNGMGESFTRRRAGGPGSSHRVARALHWWGGAGGTVGYYRKAHPENQVDGELVVFYPAIADVDLLDLVMESDREDLVAQLADVSLWGRPTSTIINIAASGERIFPFARREVPGGWELAQSVLLHHR